MMRNFEIIYGIIFIIAAIMVIFVPFYVKRKYKQRKERKAAEKRQPEPEDLTLQEVVPEHIKPEKERVVDLDPNKKFCENCGSKVNKSADVCTTCGNKF